MWSAAIVIKNDICRRHRLSLERRIRSVETTLSAYVFLTHLQLSGNEISVVQRRSFARQGRLNFLDLSDNALGSLENDAFVGLR